MATAPGQGGAEAVESTNSLQMSTSVMATRGHEMTAGVNLMHPWEVILLANRGVGGSTGVVPDNVIDMARDVLRFLDALGLRQIDLCAAARRWSTS